MFSFEFDIELNKGGRPVIEPNEKTSKEMDSLEFKFMGLEITRAVLHGVLDTTKDKESEKYKELLATTEHLYKICDIFAKAIKDQMDILKIAEKYTSSQKYDLQVKTMEELHNLNYNGIIYGDELFFRVEGLKVKVLESKKIYELQNGIDNNNWTDITEFPTEPPLQPPFNGGTG